VTIMDKAQIEKLSIEETFDSVNEIIGMLSSDDIPLEDSFNLYKEGMELISHCNNVIDGVEKQIIILQNEENTEE